MRCSLQALETAHAHCHLCHPVRSGTEPTYTERGEIEDGGADLSLGGLTGYYHDLIYISIFVQLASLISGYFWLVFLVVGISLCWSRRLLAVATIIMTCICPYY